MSLKSASQTALKRAGLYGRVKASCLYDLYSWINDKEVIREREREVKFYKDLLVGFRPGDIVFDIGANQGLKTEIFLRLGATVIAADPDKYNEKILTERFLKYRFRRKPVMIVNKAISSKRGTETFWVDQPGSELNTLNKRWVTALRDDSGRFGMSFDFKQSIVVETVTLEDLIYKYGSPFFVKIDVEGHEPSVIEGLRRPVPYLSFEVNLPEFKREGLECLEILERLCSGGRFNYTVNGAPKLASDRWLSSGEFVRIYQGCVDGSLEVFWKTIP